MHQKHSPRADFYRHLSFAAVGGFFGGYAILARCGVLASAQTMNLLEMVMDALHGKGGSALLHLLCLGIYFLGTMSTVLLPHLFHVDMRRLCPAVDVLALIAGAYIAVVREEAAERALSPARIREQEVEGETAQEMQEALDLVAEERPPKAG